MGGTKKNWLHFAGCKMTYQGSFLLPGMLIKVSAHQGTSSPLPPSPSAHLLASLFRILLLAFPTQACARAVQARTWPVLGPVVCANTGYNQIDLALKCSPPLTACVLWNSIRIRTSVSWPVKWASSLLPGETVVESMRDTPHHGVWHRGWCVMVLVKCWFSGANGDNFPGPESSPFSCVRLVSGHLLGSEESLASGRTTGRHRWHHVLQHGAPRVSVLKAGFLEVDSTDYFAPNMARHVPIAPRTPKHF